MTETHPDFAHTNRRLTHFENEVMGLGVRVSSMGNELIGVGVKVSALEKTSEKIVITLEALSNKFSEERKPQWGIIASWASVVLAIVVMYTTLSLEPLKSDTKDTKRAVKEIIANTVRIESLAERIERLENR